MKFLKKINKGLVLTILVLLILIIYLINVEVTRNKEKPEIEKICKEYIDIIDEYVKMPEGADKLYTAEERSQKAKEIEENLTKVYDKKKEGVRADLEKVMVSNKSAVDIQQNVVYGYLDSLKNSTNSVITSFNKEIVKVKKYKFDGDQVIVTFSSAGDYDEDYLSLDENTFQYKKETKRENFEMPEESITLKKENGKWKVAYADLAYYHLNNSAKPDTAMVTMGV